MYFSAILDTALANLKHNLLFIAKLVNKRIFNDNEKKEVIMTHQDLHVHVMCLIDLKGD